MLGHGSMLDDSEFCQIIPIPKAKNLNETNLNSSSSFGEIIDFVVNHL
jgi:hypothetical protein